jgi:hypothetical protein
VNLGQNAEYLFNSLRGLWERIYEKVAFLSGINGSKGIRISISQMKKMLITFFHIKGVVHFKFILQGQKSNQAYYVEILERLREAVRRKRPELRPND